MNYQQLTTNDTRYIPERKKVLASQRKLARFAAMHPPYCESSSTTVDRKVTVLGKLNFWLNIDVRQLRSQGKLMRQFMSVLSNYCGKI